MVEESSCEATHPQCQALNHDVLTSFAIPLHEHLGNMIQLSDQKAGFLFAVVSAVVAYLHDFGAIRRALTAVNLSSSITILALLLLVVSGFLSLLVISPRLSGSLHGLMFWGAIAQFTDRYKYEKRVMSLTDTDLAREHIGHCYELSLICKKKFTLLRFSVWLAAAGLTLSLLTVALSP